MDVKKQGKVNNQIIPLLFTLGVIGWGFYAIEKLSPPEEKEFESSNIGTGSWVKQSKDQTGVRKWLLSEIEAMSSERSGSSLKSKTDDSNLSIIADERSFAAPEEIVTDSFEVNSWTPVNDDLSKNAVQESSGLQERYEPYLAPGDRTFSVYFYKLNNLGDPVLTEVEKTTNSLGIAKAALLQLIHGAKAAGGLETFPVKPRVNSIKVKDKLLILDFDSNFGFGVSAELFAYQLIQIHKSLTLLSSVESIQIRVNGQMPESIGSHGIRLPEKITKSHLDEILKKLTS